jgi:hypothetical protein
MARRATSSPRGLPPPLPPERRTVGQLVAESIRLYGARFSRALPLGIPAALVNGVAWAGSSSEARLLVVAASVVLMPVGFVAACALATGTALRARSALRAYGVGMLVFAPVPFLATAFVLPGLVWLALFGLAVPVTLVERLGLRASLRRSLRLARADFVHVLGGLATLGLVGLLTQATLFFVLREYAENTQRAAAILATLVVSPVLFLGAALLYVDQEARLRSREEPPREERDADVSDADDPDREGSADAAREPGAPA